MTNLIAIAVGGAAGALARYGATLLMVRVLGPAFPWGTLLVNVVGSFALGIVLALGEAVPEGAEPRIGPGYRALLGTGFCGAFTTFSTFSVETMRMPPLPGLANVGGNLALSLLAAAAGYSIGRALRGGVAGS